MYPEGELHHRAIGCVRRPVQLDDRFPWRKLKELRFVGCGRPIEPRNLYRSFTRVAGTAGSARSGCTMPATAARPCSPPPGSLHVS